MLAVVDDTLLHSSTEHLVHPGTQVSDYLHLDMPQLHVCLKKLECSEPVFLAMAELLVTKHAQLRDWVLELQCKLHSLSFAALGRL